MIRRPPRSTQSRSSAASDVYKRQAPDYALRRRAVPYGLESTAHEGRARQRGSGSVELIDCARCGRHVTSEAPRCPECGADPRSGIATFKLSLIHISEPTRLGMISYAVFCLKKKKTKHT